MKMREQVQIVKRVFLCSLLFTAATLCQGWGDSIRRHGHGLRLHAFKSWRRTIAITAPSCSEETGILVPWNGGHASVSSALTSRRKMALQDQAAGSSSSSQQLQQVDDDLDGLEVSLEQLQGFCKMYGLDTTGDQGALLERLQKHAEEQAQHSDDGSFYFSSPESPKKKDDATTSTQTQLSTDEVEAASDDDAVKNTASPGQSDSNIDSERESAFPDMYGTSHSASLGTLPTRINEEGQTVVTTYSTTDPNDMTGFGAHSRPGDSMSGMATTLGTEGTIGGGNTQQIESTGGLSGSSKSKQEQSEDYDKARELCTSLVGQLLATTGALGFGDEFGEGIQPLTIEDENGAKTDTDAPSSIPPSPTQFVGFDPAKVPAKWLTHCSAALRYSDGKALSDVVREFEIQAIGNDGMIARNVDDPSKGGGHYREVQKVSAFLDGFRQAEVRRISRSTASMLINTIVNEGQRGLDTLLASMTRSGSDDTAAEEGQLNDALVEYLNDLVRSQRGKVDQEEQQRSSDPRSQTPPTSSANRRSAASTDEEDPVEETIDLSDPQVRAEAEQELLQQQQQQQDAAYQINGADKNTTPSQQLLVLLKLLRERVKVEAAFEGSREQARVRHLKTLAACLKARGGGTAEIDQILDMELGTSLDVRIRCFMSLSLLSHPYRVTTINVAKLA
jgi:hypothetical protein